MGIRSTLIKSLKRTGENNKPQLKSPSSGSSKTSSTLRKASNQGDSDSEATSFSSSVNGSTTSSGTSSTDRYSSGVEGGKQQRKTLDKLTSQKVAGYGSIRPARRQQSRLNRLPDDGPAAAFSTEPSDASPDLQKPLQKFTRSGSLRSLKILRRKNTSSSESKNTSTVKDLHSKKATFSSILKDSKFPEQVEPQEGLKESAEVNSSAKLCSYEHCSLHGNHHHHHEPPLKRFSYLKRRSSKDKKCPNPQVRATDKHFVNKKEAKVTNKASNEGGKEKDVDFSIEFYAKTRSEPSVEPNCGRDDVHMADIMFGVNNDEQNEVQNLQMDGQDHSIDNIDEENDKKPGVNNNNQMSMWRFIEQQLQEEQQSCFDDDVNQRKEIQKMIAVKIVREAIEKILLPEEDSSETNQGDDDQTEPNQTANNLFGTKDDKPKGWGYVKKVVLMRRFITELENAKNKLDRNKRGHVLLAPKQELEGEIVCLRSQTSGEKKESNDWMLDYALQQVVAELAPTQKRKVALLVKSFEMITPKLDKGVGI